MAKDSIAYKILVVEDNPGDFALLEDFLLDQFLSPEIIHTLNFKQAEKLLQHDTSFSVILLDLSLPDKSGEDLVKAMLPFAECCPLIILTGYADMTFSKRSISLGVSDYLLKDDLTPTAVYKSIIYAIERKNNLTEIKESEQRYSDLFNLSPQPMWLCDKETLQFIQVNKATTDLYGYSEAEFLTMTVMDIIKDPENLDPGNDNNSPHATDGVLRGTCMHHKKNGEVIQVQLFSSQIRIRDKELQSVIAIDVTEKNLAEQNITRAIIKTQEDERYEIGGELHDNVCQLLAVSQLSLGMLKDSIPGTSSNWFNQCRQNIVMATDEIRNLSHRLAPAFFKDSNLKEALDILLNNFNVGNKYKIFLNFNDGNTEADIPVDLQLNLYRIVQEQLKNISKYAKATTIEVNILIRNNKLILEIIDNGIGFNPASVKYGIGIANMKRRAAWFSGRFSMDAEVGNGCAVTIEVPMQNRCRHKKQGQLNGVRYHK